jgi:hypothetical protein
VRLQIETEKYNSMLCNIFAYSCCNIGNDSDDNFAAAVGNRKCSKKRNGIFRYIGEIAFSDFDMCVSDYLLCIEIPYQKKKQKNL